MWMPVREAQTLNGLKDKLFQLPHHLQCATVNLLLHVEADVAADILHCLLLNPTPSLRSLTFLSLLLMPALLRLDMLLAESRKLRWTYSLKLPQFTQ
ncbi:hypothetical protein L596_022787 [Steinernema carpocapsae]|uniref:Uncharacterized protein n=1 Tax=Steinernema carpocapsae TaxID=34508 RepID=A0A4U5MPB3_STECR|nr:hypothetical protein L596_022787 [Steinernema carpocapsae]